MAKSLATWQTTQISSVHEPCREHCLALVQDFCVGELGLNTAAACRRAARENRKVFRKPVHPLPRPAV